MYIAVELPSNGGECLRKQDTREQSTQVRKGQGHVPKDFQLIHVSQLRCMSTRRECRRQHCAAPAHEYVPAALLPRRWQHPRSSPTIRIHAILHTSAPCGDAENV
jgi:hypothetical protein